jgi:hypothetical protein
MDFGEIAVGELVTTLVLLSEFIVLAQVPSAISRNPVFPDEFVLGCAGRLVLAPSIPLVEHALPIPDELLGVLERAADQLD